MEARVFGSCDALSLLALQRWVEQGRTLLRRSAWSGSPWSLLLQFFTNRKKMQFLHFGLFNVCIKDNLLCIDLGTAEDLRGSCISYQARFIALGAGGTRAPCVSGSEAEDEQKVAQPNCPGHCSSLVPGAL